MLSPDQRFRVQSHCVYTEDEVADLTRRLDAVGISHTWDDGDARGPGVLVGW